MCSISREEEEAHRGEAGADGPGAEIHLARKDAVAGAVAAAGKT